MTKCQSLERTREVWNTYYKERSGYGNLEVSGRAEISDLCLNIFNWKKCPSQCPPAKPWWKLHPPSEEELVLLLSSRMCWFSYVINCTIIFPAFTSSAHSLSFYSTKLRTLISAKCVSHNRSTFIWASDLGLTKCPCISTNHQHKLAGLACSVQQLSHLHNIGLTETWLWSLDSDFDEGRRHCFGCFIWLHPFISGHMGSRCSLMWNKEAFYKKNIGDIVRSQATRHW